MIHWYMMTNPSRHTTVLLAGTTGKALGSVLGAGSVSRNSYVLSVKHTS